MNTQTTIDTQGNVLAASLTHYLQTDFPVDAMMYGLCHAQWFPSTFYGDKHHGPRDRKYPGNQDSSRLYNHFEKQIALNDWVIPLTYSLDQFSWARTDEQGIWKRTSHAREFQPVMKWMEDQQILKHFGRITVFISQGQTETPHVDWEPGTALSNFRTTPVDFFWYSGESGGKNMEVEGQRLDSDCCWFDNRKFHRAVCSKLLTWSIRADGRFQDHIKIGQRV